MSFDRDFLNMMPQTVDYYAYSTISTGGYGEPSYATAKSVKARIQAVRADIRTPSGREVKGASFKVLMAPYSTAGTSDTITVTVLDKIILPSSFIVDGSSSPPILRAYPVQDSTGHHHNEVWV